MAVLVPLLAGAAPASGAIVINEVETQGADFVELYNNGGATVDISSFAVDDDSATPASGAQVPGGTMLAAGGYHVVTTAGGLPGLGGADEAHLYNAADVEIDGLTWTVDPSATYGRCTNGFGSFTGTSSTPGAENACPIPAVAWPGGTTVSAVDTAGVLGQDVSGLAYQPSGTTAPGVLWAVKNDPGTLYRLVWNGTIWTPDTTNGWTNGKLLRYQGLPASNPDAEGVTLAGGDPNGIYVATERDGAGTTRPAILRFDVTAAGTELTATDDFNLTPNLPNLNDNGGLEAITWIPDTFLVAEGFKDEATNLPYNPANYANHGTGVFFVGVENLGHIVGYAVNSVTDGFTRVATIQSPPNVMDLKFEDETELMWAACDNDCNGRYTRFEVGPLGNFVVKDAFQRPAGMPNLNNEGFTIAPQLECVGGLKPVIWADDDAPLGGNVLRQGTLNCTTLPDGDGDGVPNVIDNCPAVANPGQANLDGDSQGDACDGDDDNDGIADGADACPAGAIGPAPAEDADGDGCRNSEDADDDNDGVLDGADNCPTGNPIGPGDDIDHDGCGSGEDVDDDGDGVLDGADNCQTVAPAPGTDLNGDGCADAAGNADADADGVPDASDNCKNTANAGQADADKDGIGDACDPKDDVACAQAQAKLKKAKKALKKAKKSGKQGKIKKAKKKVKKAQAEVKKFC